MASVPFRYPAERHGGRSPRREWPPCHSANPVDDPFAGLGTPRRAFPTGCCQARPCREWAPSHSVIPKRVCPSRTLRNATEGVPYSSGNPAAMRLPRLQYSGVAGGQEATPPVARRPHRKPIRSLDFAALARYVQIGLGEHEFASMDQHSRGISCRARLRRRSLPRRATARPWQAVNVIVTVPQPIRLAGPPARFYAAYCWRC